MLDSDSYSVLRAPSDTWLAEEAENEGAMYVCGIRVDDLIIRDGRVCGVIAGDEEMEADVVILADRVNSLLAQKLGMKPELLPEQTAVGIKEVAWLFDLERMVRLHTGLTADCTGLDIDPEAPIFNVADYGIVGSRLIKKDRVNFNYYLPCLSHIKTALPDTLRHQSVF